MMKFLLLIAVVGIALWFLRSKSRGRGDASGQRKNPGGAQPMLACAHCGVHLPLADAVKDADDRPYCSEAHRLAGPR